MAFNIHFLTQMSSPPKPWESKPNNNSVINPPSSSSLPTPPASALSTPSVSTDSLVGIPALPSRPETSSLPNTRNSSLNSVYGNTAGGYGATGYGTNGYGTTGYGVTNGYGATGYSGGLYGSNMGIHGNRMSPYGSSYGGGLYGSGGMYGGLYGNNMGMYGNRIGGYGNRLGPNGMPFEGGEMSFTQQMELSTQSTFQILDQIVQVFIIIMIIRLISLLGFWRVCANVRVNFFRNAVFLHGHDRCR